MSTSFIVSKIVASLLYPLGWVFSFSVLSAILGLLGKHRQSFFCTLLAIAVLVCFSTPYIPNKAGWAIEKLYLPLKPSSYPRTDVIIVLGGGLSPRRWPEQAPALNGRSDRFHEAARLYHATRAPFVLLSGGDGLEKTVDGQISKDGVRLLKQLGVPEAAIIAEASSLNTEQNAQESLKLMQAREFRKALLVTSAIHMPRSVATFRTVGIDVIPAPTDYRFSDSLPDTPLAWFPQIDMLMRSTAIVREYIGFAVYRWRGAIGDSYGYIVSAL